MKNILNGVEMEQEARSPRSAELPNEDPQPSLHHKRATVA